MWKLILKIIDFFIKRNPLPEKIEPIKYTKPKTFKSLEGIPYFDQLNNEFFATTSCYSESMSMPIAYCLKKEGYDKSYIGCPQDMQIGDYITQETESEQIKLWIKENVSRYGNWMLKYKPRTIAYVQSHIFNKFMGSLGYHATFRDNLTYDDFCTCIDNGFPVVLHGDFSSVNKRVRGHIVCGVGYLKKNKKIIVNDPYGSVVLDNYRSHNDGEGAVYPIKFFIKNKERGLLWGQVITKS